MAPVNSETTVETEKLITCSDIDIVTGECYAAQTAVGAATFKVDPGRVPVDVQYTRKRRK